MEIYVVNGMQEIYDYIVVLNEEEMKILIFAAAAVTAYLVAGWNPAITFSKGIYKKDIRECGSGNPGFTNFRRTFGNKWAWCVLLLDILKSAAVVAFWAEVMDARWSCYELGASFTAFFALLGHAFPLWYRFRGGKGFLVCLSGVWVMDWRAGLMATLLMVIILLAARYMSLATVVSCCAARRCWRLWGRRCLHLFSVKPRHCLWLSDIRKISRGS